MRALVIQQPWAWAIFHANPRKRYENRNWQTGHRGPLAIVAGKAVDRIDFGTGWLEDHGMMPPFDFPLGVVVGVVQQTGCVPSSEVSPREAAHIYAEGPWCHVYDRPMPLQVPIPCRGFPGMFDLPEELLKEAVFDA